MERLGLFGFVVTWSLNLFAFILGKVAALLTMFQIEKHIQYLQVVSLYFAIIVSVVTLIIRRKELIKAIRDIIRDLKGR